MEIIYEVTSESRVNSKGLIWHMLTSVFAVLDGGLGRDTTKNYSTNLWSNIVIAYRRCVMPVGLYIGPKTWLSGSEPSLDVLWLWL